MAFHIGAVCAWSRSNRRCYGAPCPQNSVTNNIKRFLKCNWVTGSPPKFDTLLASWYPAYMQSFIISHSSCAEQLWRQVFGETHSHTHTHTHTQTFFLKYNRVTGSPPKFDILLASWYPTYMQSFIISHSSCAEQCGDMSSERLTHSHTNFF